MKKKKLLCWVLTLILALSIVSIPTTGYAVTEEDRIQIQWKGEDGQWWNLDGDLFDTALKADITDATKRTYDLQAVHYDEDFNESQCTGTVEWSSDNPDMVDITGNGGQVTLTVKKAGEATITARCGENTCEFFIYAPIEYENALYSVSPDGKVTLRNVSATKWNGTVPPTVSGSPVTTIASAQAYDNDGANIVEGTTIVTIPASVTNITDNAFWTMNNLTAINVASANPSYYSIDGVLFSNTYMDEAYKTLHTYPRAKQGTCYTIPNGTQRIVDYSIEPGSTGLKELEIPTSLELEWYQDPLYDFSVRDDADNITGWNIKLYIVGSNPTFEEYAKGYGIPWERRQETPGTLPDKPSGDKGNQNISSESVASGDNLTAEKATDISVRKVSGLKLKAGKKKLTARWKKDSSATGYQIVYSTNKKFKKNVKKINVGNNKTIKKTIKKLKSKKYCYVKVRAYKTVSGTKIYGPYSAVKKIRIK